MRPDPLLAATLSCVLATIACADSWGPIEQTEFYSENRKHMLRFEPHPDWPSKPGHCRAVLFKGGKELWSRYLINNHAPVRVFVADSGDYVLTMDEWHSVGELPVVIYGRRGELVRVHSTDSLGLKDDIEHIKQTVSSYWWNEDSISFFGPDEETFLIRLHWGELILLQLRDGDLMDEEWYGIAKGWLMPEKKWTKLHEFGRTQLQKHAIRLLASKDAQQRKTGAMICGQEKLTEAIPALRELLNDEASFSTNVPEEWTRLYFVRKAAKDALEAMGQEVKGVIVEEPETR